MVKCSISPQSRREFAGMLKQFQAKKGRDVADSIIILAKTAAAKLAHKVPRYGLSDKWGDAYKVNIAKQVNLAIRRGNIKGTSGSAGTVHEQFRVRGRVPANRGEKAPRGQFKREPVDRSEVELLIKRKMGNAGRMKAGWIAAGESIKSPFALTKSGKAKKIGGVGKWIRRHVNGNVGSSAMSRRKGISTTVILSNDVPYVSRVQTLKDVSSALRLAYNQEYRRMQRQIEQ